MKKPLYYLDQYEKQRILEMHNNAYRKEFIKEEKQILNEFWLALLGIGLAAGGAAALYKNWDSLTGQKSKDAFSQINKGCDRSEANQLKSFNTQKDYNYIAKKLNESFDWSVLGMDWGTYNETVTKLLKRIKSVGDYCKVKKEYEKLFTDDLGEKLMDEVSQNFDSIVMNALSGAIKKTMEVDGDVPGYKKIEDRAKEDDSLDIGGGSSDSNVEKDNKEEDGISYVACKNEFYKGCMDPMYGSEIKKLQRCLKLEPTGKFNTETENALKGETGKTKVTSSEISYICGEF
jgi:hypothetical protein